MTEAEQLKAQKKRLKEKLKTLEKKEREMRAKEALLFYEFATTYQFEVGQAEAKHTTTVYELYKWRYKDWLEARESKKKNHKNDGSPGRAQ